MALTHSASSRGMPVKAMVLVRNAAPARMNMIMQLVRVVPIRPSQKLLHVSEPPHHAMASEPATPYAAHSVAVAQPATRTQTMNTMSTAQGMRLPDCLNFCAQVLGGSAAGTWSGLRRLHQMM